MQTKEQRGNHFRISGIITFLIKQHVLKNKNIILLSNG